MVFIDGTNLLYRLKANKLRLQARMLQHMCSSVIGGRQVTRTYVYTTEPHWQRAKTDHEADFDAGTRVVFGEAVPLGDGNHKEKGVDAMLVADLVYHAATRNLDFAVLVSVDADFAQALRRVEDFGCKTAVVAVCAEAPPSLARATDHVFTLTEDDLITRKLAK
jgi:uncharacterized LabA/DUF88 family protein